MPERTTPEPPTQQQERRIVTASGAVAVLRLVPDESSRGAWEQLANTLRRPARDTQERLHSCEAGEDD
jgi:hypothetical protein